MSLCLPIYIKYTSATTVIMNHSVVTQFFQELFIQGICIFNVTNLTNKFLKYTKTTTESLIIISKRKRTRRPKRATLQVAWIISSEIISFDDKFVLVH